MEMPKLVYHGTFWPEGTQLGSEDLRTDYGYVSVTPDRRWARYFSMCRRWEYKRQSGNLVIYEIDTDKLPQDVREKGIPPDGFDPRLIKSKTDWLRKHEEEMKEERIKIQEWRVKYIPLEAIVNLEEEHKDAQPDLDTFSVSLYQPK